MTADTPLAVVLLTILLGIHCQPCRGIDENENSLNDVWEAFHGPAPLLPFDDPDGDGLTNIHESVAGTNPWQFESSLTLELSASSGDPKQVVLGWPSVKGKRYNVWRAEDAVSESWIRLDLSTFGDGGELRRKCGPARPVAGVLSPRGNRHRIPT